MYCSVETLSDFISQTDPNAPSLLKRCSKLVLTSPKNEPTGIWYTYTPIKHYQFTRLLYIPKNAIFFTTYTAH